MPIYTEDFNVSIVTESGCVQRKGAVGRGRSAAWWWVISPCVHRQQLWCIIHKHKNRSGKQFHLYLHFIRLINNMTDTAKKRRRCGVQSRDHIQSHARREKRGREVMRGESNGGKVVGKLCEEFVVLFWSWPSVAESHSNILYHFCCGIWHAYTVCIFVLCMEYLDLLLTICQKQYIPEINTEISVKEQANKKKCITAWLCNI